MKDLSTLRSTIRATSAFRQITEDDVSYLIEVGELRTYERKRPSWSRGRSCTTQR